ncbi:hypothetical protein NFC81_11080 [Salinispirillum sp. LH 10-3-1]|uniref:Uncharacterized protein n=1 Tax=Salinispirillum sp. LH 10-3-1 TaxID=2952525 RepID=A0AB38YD52_9GAMM
MRKEMLALLIVVLALTACGDDTSTTAQSTTVDHSDYDTFSALEYGSADDEEWVDVDWNPDVQCPPALEPLFLMLPAVSQFEGQLLSRQNCGVNLAIKVYGNERSDYEGDAAPLIIFQVHSYTTQYTDWPGVSVEVLQEHLNMQRQGLGYWEENLREMLRWAAEPDIYTEHQLARMPRELLWHGSVPGWLDNGNNFWAMTFWATPDVTVSISLLDSNEPDMTTERALERFTPLANAVNFNALR